MELPKRVLLVSPSYASLYKGTKIKAGAIYTPLLSMATLAGSLLAAGHEAQILDLNLEEDVENGLWRKLEEFEREVVGITSTTPLFHVAARAAELVRARRNSVLLLVGGSHATAYPYPEDVLAHSCFDVVCVGEDDWDTVDRHFTQFYPEFYFRPSFIAKRFLRSLRYGHLLADVKHFLATRW